MDIAVDTQTLNNQKDIPQEVFDYVSSILESEQIAVTWDRWNPNKIGKCPNHAISQDLTDAVQGKGKSQGSIHRKHALSFMRQLIEWQRTNLGKSGVIEKAHLSAKALKARNSQRDDADKVAGLLRDILPDAEMVDYDDLPKPQRKLLGSLKRATAQRFRLWSDFKASTQHVAGHIRNNIKAAPIISGLTLGLALPASAGLIYEGFQRTDTKLTTEQACTTNASASDVFLDPDYTPEVDLENCNLDYRSCHDELKSTLPTLVTYMEGRGIKIPDLPHCTTVNSYASKSQETLVGGTELLSDIVYAIGDIFGDNPIEEAQRTDLFEGSYFVEGADKVSENVQHFLNFINRAENSIHLPLGILFVLFGMQSAMKIGRMSFQTNENAEHEWEHFKEDMVGLWNTMTKTRPLAFAVPVLGGAAYLNQYGYDSSKTIIDQNLMLIGYGGAALGYIAHKLDAKFRKNNKNAFAIASNSTAFREEFTQEVRTLTEQLKQEAPERWKAFGKKYWPALPAAAAYGGIVAADISKAIASMPEGIERAAMEMAAQAAGMATVTSSITVPTVLYNFLVEDPAQHIFFIGGGYTAGFTAGAALGAGVLGTRLAIDYTKKYRQDTKNSFNDSSAGVEDTAPHPVEKTTSFICEELPMIGGDSGLQDYPNLGDEQHQHHHHHSCDHH